MIEGRVFLGTALTSEQTSNKPRKRKAQIYQSKMVEVLVALAPVDN